MDRVYNHSGAHLSCAANFNGLFYTLLLATTTRLDLQSGLMVSNELLLEELRTFLGICYFGCHVVWWDGLIVNLEVNYLCR